MEDENLLIEGLSAETSSQSDDRVEALEAEYQTQLEEQLKNQLLLCDQAEERGDLLEKMIVEVKAKIKDQVEQIKIQEKIISELAKELKR